MANEATIGHNNPPDPIEDVIAEYADTLSEAENWTDGEPVTDEASMNAVDAVIKEFRSYKSALTKAGKERTEPLHKAWKEEVAAVKVYTEDADKIQKALAATVAPFKAKLAEQKEAERRAAWEAAEAARKEAEAIAAKANEASLSDAREAEAAKQAALEAHKAAQSAQKDKVKGLRTVTHHEIVNMRDLVSHIAKTDKDAMAAFATEYARKNHNDIPDGIVRTWQTKEAY